MDHTMERIRAASMVSAAIQILNEAAERSREAKVFKVCAQLRDLSEELIYLHRELLELPPQRTPAACEFERAELDSDVPF